MCVLVTGNEVIVLFSTGFRFPLPFLGAVVAMSVLLYQVGGCGVVGVV